MLSRRYVFPPHLILVKLPTAYMVEPHCTSCRTCSVVPVDTSEGVPETGTGDTGPVCAAPAEAPGARARRQHAVPAEFSSSDPSEVWKPPMPGAGIAPFPWKLHPELLSAHRSWPPT